MKKLITLSYEMLKNEHLSVIRELGRYIGVKAPTEQNKESVIQNILDIQNGTATPVERSKKGAPPKFEVDISKYFVKDEQEFERVDKINFSDRTPVEGTYVMEGVLEQHVQGYGFLRANNYENSKDDAFVARPIIKKYNLRRGDKVRAIISGANRLDGGSPAVITVDKINDLDPKLFLERANFDELIPYYPTERIKLERNDQVDLALRSIDLFAPLGMGQRGLIVAPPKTGKTTLIKKIASSIEKNCKDVKLILLLIDERPEEVTDIKRSVNGEVVFSTFDEGPSHHVRAAELVINRAKRLVEVGQNVVILMDSITRLTRAYNSVVESSGKILSGGIDPYALQGPKSFFGAARNIENGGSLTILATALIETGSRMDDVIYEEFKGTGNMEIHLSRSLSERRIFPAIDLNKSGTRRDDLLLTEQEMDAVCKIRRIICERQDATDTLLDMLKKTKDNADLISKIDAWEKLYNK